MEFKTYLVTVKLPKNPAHDPRSKVTGECPVSGKQCTDVTGEHHTVTWRDTSIEAALAHLFGEYSHITRIEEA